MSTAYPEIRSVRMLENLAFRTWLPAEIGLAGGWALGATGGFTRRANSAQALGDPGIPRTEIGEALEGWYRRRHLAPCAKISPATPEWVDPMLKERGWKLVSPASVMTLSLTQTTMDAGRYPVSTFAMPPSRWLYLSTDWEDYDPASLDSHQGILQRIPTPGFLTLHDKGEAVAVGICALEGSDAYLYGIVVDPRHRRKGMGRAMTQALLNFARSKNAHRALLQVLHANLAARKLYESLGFQEAYRYHYRELPLS